MDNQPTICNSEILAAVSLPNSAIEYRLRLRGTEEYVVETWRYQPRSSITHDKEQDQVFTNVLDAWHLINNTQIACFASEVAVKILCVEELSVLVKLLGSGQHLVLELTTEDIGRDLKNHLHCDAVLKGYGEWEVDPKKFSTPTRLVKFKISSYRILTSSDMDNTVGEMTKASNGIWDEVDPTKPIDSIIL